ncbi:MAG: Holliday junction resolvase YqgF, putative holliday junction resolvase [Candidatus Taylorbacteria bacterium]|nr:Holliday junction resolvase YqgF, putative holliday junction resolvase [Candidatus Taylorbacteria bacterium]
MKYLGIDYGSKRVGIAVSDLGGRFALPKKVIRNGGSAAAMAALVVEIVALAAEEKVSEIVMGESKDFSGNENPIMAAAKAFALELRTATGMPVHMEPEFMTSHQAERTQHELGGSREMLDASAAAVILQSFLDRERDDADLGE